jgi:hypothetical protein
MKGTSVIRLVQRHDDHIFNNRVIYFILFSSNVKEKRRRKVKGKCPKVKRGKGQLKRKGNCCFSKKKQSVQPPFNENTQSA